MKRFVFFILAFLIFVGIGVAQGLLEIISGYIKMARMETTLTTNRWGGFFGECIGTGSEGITPVASVSLTSNQILKVGLGCSNLLDGKHYLMFSLYDITFNLTKLRDMNSTDLEKNGVFSERDFSWFYPNYDLISDSPKKTFLEFENIVVGGITFRAAKTLLKNNVNFYVLKYEENSTFIFPLFFVKIKDWVCFDGSSCNYEAMLPANESYITYYIYILSEIPPIKFETWIDNVKAETFERTSLPYNLTLRITNLYTGEPLSEKKVAAFEKDGNNLFLIPKSEYFSFAFGSTYSNGKGYASFIVVPTEYQSPPTYKIGVSVVDEEYNILADKNLSVEKTSILPTKKDSFIAPHSTGLKWGVNWLRPIANCFFYYVSSLEKVCELLIDSPSNHSLVRGVPYLLRFTDPQAALVRIEERNGYLVLMPNRNLTLWNFTHYTFNSSTTPIIITTTLEGGEEFKAYVYDSNQSLLYTVSFQASESTCATPACNLISYSSREVKQAINAIRPVLNSIFFSIQ